MLQNSVDTHLDGSINRKHRPHVIRFLLSIVLWLVLFGSSVFIYNWSYPYTAELLIGELQARPAAWVLKHTLPDVSVHRMGTSIVAPPDLELKLLRGCDGIEAWLLLVTSLAAFPMPWRQRVKSAACGTLLVFGLNLVRIVTLFHIALSKPAWFDIAHGVVWQSIMVLSASYFMLVSLSVDNARAAVDGQGP